eukprot:NODE_51_length_31136_cov_0.357670.p9 type:complete len:305 gc:universal NODE_51_length_31136_cov_0.357670:19385-18471(-)
MFPELNLFRLTLISVCIIGYVLIDLETHKNNEKNRRVPVNMKNSTCIQKDSDYSKCINSGKIAIAIYVDPGSRTQEILGALKKFDLKITFVLTPSKVTDWNLVSLIALDLHNFAIKTSATELESNKKLFLRNLGVVPKYILSPILMPDSEASMQEKEAERQTILINNFVPFMYSKDTQDYHSSLVAVQDRYKEDLTASSDFISIHNEFSDSFNIYTISFINDLANSSNVKIVKLEECFDVSPYWDNCTMPSNSNAKDFKSQIKSNPVVNSPDENSYEKDKKSNQSSAILYSIYFVLIFASINLF